MQLDDYISHPAFQRSKEKRNYEQFEVDSFQNSFVCMTILFPPPALIIFTCVPQTLQAH